MTSEGLGEIFEGDSADMFAHVDVGLSGGSSVSRPGSEDPIGVSGIFKVLYFLQEYSKR